MKSKVLPNNPPKTDAEYQQEADRLLGEIREMLADSQRSMERAARIGKKNRQAIEQLRQQLCGKI